MSFGKMKKGEKLNNQRSFRCYVLYFFIYKKGKHQKWCLNTEGEKVGAEHVWMSAARMHADLILDLWPALQGPCTLGGGWLS